MWGRATDETLDRDSQVIAASWAGPALKVWLDTGANVRQSHDPSKPIGKGISVETDNNGATWVRSCIVDPLAQKFLRKGVLTSYSLGVSHPVIKRDPSGRARNGIICGGEVAELTLCDRPSNPSCGVTLVKSAANGTAQYIGKAWKTPKLTKSDRRVLELIDSYQPRLPFEGHALVKGEDGQGMIARILERTVNTTENPAEREFSRMELARMMGKS
ncbi:MAG: hypothetical protein WBM24_03220 [Candidatus Sulfotelmatobacter sp.]